MPKTVYATEVWVVMPWYVLTKRRNFNGERGRCVVGGGRWDPGQKKWKRSHVNNVNISSLNLNELILAGRGALAFVEVLPLAMQPETVWHRGPERVSRTVYNHICQLVYLLTYLLTYSSLHLRYFLRPPSSTVPFFSFGVGLVVTGRVLGGKLLLLYRFVLTRPWFTDYWVRPQ